MSLKTSLIIDLAGNLTSRANQFMGSLQRLGQGGSRSMNVLHRSIQAAGNGLDRLGNRYTALFSGGAAAGMIKQVGDLSQRLTYLGITANADAEAISRLHQRIMDAAQMKDVRVDPGEILSGVEVIVEKLGDLDYATSNLRNIGLVMRATGAEGKDAGDMIANFKEKFQLRTPEEVTQALDILVKQGKTGSFTLKDMVTQGNRVTAAYGSMGRSGLNAVREMGAVLQVFRKSSGSAEETSTAFKNVFADLMEPGKQKYLKALGVNIWDPVKLKEGKKQVRNIVDIIDELLRKTAGDPQKLSRIFGMQSLDGLKAFISEWQKTGKNAAREFMDINGDGAELQRDSARAAQEFNAAMTNLYTSWKRFSQNNLTAPIQKMADVLNRLDQKTVDRWLKVMGGGAMALGGSYIAKKGWDILSWGRGMFKGGKGASGLPGGVPGAGNAIPVYVVNLPGGLPGVPTSSGPVGTAGKAGKLGTILKTLPWLAGGKVALMAALAGGIYFGANALVRKATDGKADSLGGLLYNYLQKQKAESQKKAELSGKIKIEITQDGRPVIRSLQSSSPGVRFDVSTGMLMGWQ